MQLQGDETLTKSQAISSILNSGVNFIDKRAEFWRSQGSQQKGSNLRKPPAKLKNIGVRNAPVDFDGIISNLQRCQNAMQDKDFETADDCIKELDQQLQNVIITNGDEKLHAEK